MYISKRNESVEDFHPYGKPKSKQRFKSGNLFTESQALTSVEPLIRDQEQTPAQNKDS